MDVLKKLLSKYYGNAELWLPEDFTLREFAFQTYEEAVYVRHMNFQSLALLRNYLIRNTPRQAYYSSALYRDPAADRMEDKGWLGSELVFDIDSDHIEGCEVIELSIKDKSLSLVKPQCIELAKEHELRLIDILKYEFGFSNDEIRIQFSGNRGFHTIVRPKDKEWLLLEPHHRREIVDYIKGIGLDINRILPRSKRIRLDLSYVDGGWLRRLKHENEVNEEVINKLRVEIDEQVTQDISRLVRIPGSLNGKMGLPALIISSESSLISFKYDMTLSPFDGEYAIVKLHEKLPRETEFLGEVIRIDDHESLNKVPLPFAVFLALNKVASILKIL